MVSTADGYAEREAAKMMIADAKQVADENSGILQRTGFCDYRATTQQLCSHLNLVQICIIAAGRDQLSV